MFNEIQEQVDLYNKYAFRSEMEVIETGCEFYELIVDGQFIMEGDCVDVLTRLEQINREEGFSFLKGE